jgi:type I restriction enzyme S subunit
MYIFANVTAQPNFNNDVLFVNNLLPPLQEQNEIVEYLEGISKKIDHCIESLNRQITKLKELRVAMISDAVTGKIKVEEEVKSMGEVA